MKTTTRRFFGLLAAIGTGLGLVTTAHADGYDTLGPPSIPIKPGTDVIAAGTGLVNQPGTISIDIPAGVSIEQVLLYWGGRTGFPNTPFDLDSGPSDTITVNSLIPVTGTRINDLTGLPVPFGSYPASSTYRADVTALDLVINGSNSVTIEGLDFNFHNNGASLVVIIDDGAAGALTGGVDGTDVIVTESNPDIGILLGVPQTFSFPPAAVERDARLWIIAGDAGEPFRSTGIMRPDAISFRVGSGPEVIIPDVFEAVDGLRWDTLEFLITIPAGETEVTVVPLSTDLRTPPSGVTPESITWIGAFLSIRSGTIGDTVFCDIDANGIQDGSDFGIPGVTVNLTCTDTNGNTVTLTTVTDANGKYLFEGLPPAICDVSVDLSTLPPDCDGPVPNCPPLVNVDLGPGEVFLDADFCFTRPGLGTIGDTIFCDIDANGIQDGPDFGIPNVKLRLKCFDSNGNLVINRITSTDANGKYLFDNLPPGLCVVTVARATLPLDCDDPVPNCPFRVRVDLGPGEVFLDADFCFTRPRVGRIGDTVYCDLNGNGVQDLPEDVGIPGVTVVLDCGFGPIPAVTDANGKYLFEDVPPGTCTVTVDQSTLPDDCDDPVCDTSVVVNLGPNEEYFDADFCFTRPGKIGDFVFCDDNRNGQLDSGEHGIEGVTVTLECKDPVGNVILTATTTTDVNGKYCFEDLDPGLCKVTVDPFAVPGKTPTCPTEVTVNLDQGEIYLDADFCYGPDCSIDLEAFCFVPLPPASGNDDCGDDKVAAITMVYTADDCNATSSSQDSDKVSCEDFGALPDNAFIIVTDEDEASDALAGDGDTYFRGNVSKDGVFSATAANAGEDKFSSSTYVYVFTSEAGKHRLRQAVEFHTSCSQPLAVGNQFGANLIVELNFDNGRVVTLPDPSGPTLEKNCVITRTSGEICPSGDDIFALELLYTAEDCSATSSSQKSDKVSCEDFGALPDDAFIIVTDEDKVSDALDGKGKTYFRGNVSKNSLFSATAANAGEDKFSGETHVFVFTSESAGENGLRQQIEFHTSCSQPINTGDQFGGIVIFGGDTKEGRVSQGSTVTFVYEVSNTAPVGGSDLTDVSVTDAYGPVPGSPIASIAPGGVVVLERTVTVSSQVVNTVVATGQPAPCEDVDAVTISVVDPPAPPKECESSIQAMLLSYIGPDVAGPVTVTIEPSSGPSVTYNLPGGLATGDKLSSGSQGGWSIDALVGGNDSLGSKVFILINGTDPDGGIHTSCSAPFIQGQPAPLNDPKGDPSPTWFVEDFRDKD